MEVIFNMFCTECGSQISKQASFCAKCGSAIDAVGNDQIAESTTELKQNSVHFKKSNKNLWDTWAPAFGIAVFVVVGFIAYEASKKEEASSSSATSANNSNQKNCIC